MGAAAAPKRASAPAPRAPARKPARRSTTRRAPAARRAPTRRARPAKARATASRNGFAQPALAGAALIPQAAVRGAGAVRDLSDSGLIMRLTRGRGWIAVLCVLLGGIVTLNVVSLSLNAASGRVSRQINELERVNSGLRAELAEELSSSRIAQLAPGLGYYVPDPSSVGYVTARDEDLAKLLKLFSNEMVLGRSAPVDTVSAPEPAYEVPATTATPVEEAVVAPEAPAAPAPVAPAPTAPAPAAPTAPAPAPATSTSATGGVGL